MFFHRRGLNAFSPEKNVGDVIDLRESWRQTHFRGKGKKSPEFILQRLSTRSRENCITPKKSYFLTRPLLSRKWKRKKKNSRARGWQLSGSCGVNKMHLPIGFAAVAGKPWRVAVVPRNDNSMLTGHAQSLPTLTLTFHTSKNVVSYSDSDSASKGIFCFFNPLLSIIMFLGVAVHRG